MKKAEWFDSHTFSQTRRHRRSWACRRSGSWSGWCFWSWAWQAWSRRRSSASAGSVQQPLGTPTTRTTPRHILRSASHVSFAKTACLLLCIPSSILSFFPNQRTMKFSAPFRVFHAKSRTDPPIAFSCILAFVFFFFPFLFSFVGWVRGFGRDSFVRWMYVHNKESLFQLDYVYRVNNTVQESSLINISFLCSINAFSSKRGKNVCHLYFLHDE